MSSVDPIEFHSGSLIYTAELLEPAFELMHAGPMLLRHIHRALRDFEIDLAGMQEAMPIGPGHWSLSANFLAFRASLKLQVSNVIVTFLNELIHDAALIEKVLQAVEHAVFQVAPDIVISRRELLQQIHCKMASAEIDERIPVLPGAFPEELGGLAGRAMGVYFTSPLSSGRASVVMDRSAVLNEGMFAQVRCSFDSQAFDLATSCGNFRTYLTRIDRAFRLDGSLGRAT
jgi:hypothetical protein